MDWTTEPSRLTQNDALTVPGGGLVEWRSARASAEASEAAV